VNATALVAVIVTALAGDAPLSALKGRLSIRISFGVPKWCQNGPSSGAGDCPALPATAAYIAHLQKSAAGTHGQPANDIRGDEANCETRMLAGKVRDSDNALLPSNTSIIQKLAQGASLLNAHTVNEVTECTTEAVKTHVQARHTDRAGIWTKDICHDWKNTTNAPTLLRGPQQWWETHHRHQTSRRAVRDAWQPVFNRPVNVQPPDWDNLDPNTEIT